MHEFKLNLVAPPADSAFAYFLRKRRKSAATKFVPDLCQRIADLDDLAGLGRRKNSKLPRINSSRGTDSVPGHHVFRYLQPPKTSTLFHSVPKTNRLADLCLKILERDLDVF